MKLLLEDQGCFPVLCFPLLDLCYTLSSITEGESNNLVFLIHFLIFGFLKKNMRCRGAQSLGQNMKGFSKSHNTIKLTFLYGAWISHPSSRPRGGGGTPLYTPYRCVPPHWVGFLRPLGLKTSLHFVKPPTHTFLGVRHAFLPNERSREKNDCVTNP